MVESSSHPNNMAQTILDRDSPLYCCPNKESRHGRLALCALYQPVTSPPPLLTALDASPRATTRGATHRAQPLEKGMFNIFLHQVFVLPQTRLEREFPKQHSTFVIGTYVELNFSLVPRICGIPIRVFPSQVRVNKS